MDIYEFIGITGAALVLVGFVMEQTHKWKDTSFVYDGVNFLGGVLLTVYAFAIGSYPFLVINVVWSLVSLRDLLRRRGA